MPRDRFPGHEGNTITFRHPLFFTFDGAIDDGEMALADLYPDYDPEHPKGLEQFVGKSFDDATCERLGIMLPEKSPYRGMTRDAGWVLRRRRTRRDEREARNLTFVSGIDWLKMLDTQQHEGEHAVTVELLRQGQATPEEADLIVQTESRYGAYFTVPTFWTLAHETGLEEDAHTRHPWAGKLIPMTVRGITLEETVVFDAAMTVLRALFAGRDPEQERRFPARDLPSPDAVKVPAGDGSGAGDDQPDGGRLQKIEPAA